MFERIPFLYEQNPKAFIERLPFLSSYEYGAWLIHMAHIEGFDCVDEIVFKDIQVNEQTKLIKTNSENIKLAYNKLLAFNFLGHAWLHLIRGRHFEPNEQEVLMLSKLVSELRLGETPMGIPFSVIDRLHAEMQLCEHYITVCNLIQKAFIKQKYSTKDFERFLCALDDNENLPSQKEVLIFYTKDTKK